MNRDPGSYDLVDETTTMHLRQSIKLLILGAFGFAASFVTASQVRAQNPCQAQYDARNAALTACTNTGDQYACYACLGQNGFANADRALKACHFPETPLAPPAGMECDSLGEPGGSEGSGGSDGGWGSGSDGGWGSAGSEGGSSW